MNPAYDWVLVIILYSLQARIMWSLGSWLHMDYEPGRSYFMLLSFQPEHASKLCKVAHVGERQGKWSERGCAELCVVMGKGAECISLSLGNCSKYNHEPVRKFACAEWANSAKDREILLIAGPKAKWKNTGLVFLLSLPLWKGRDPLWLSGAEALQGMLSGKWQAWLAGRRWGFFVMS